MKKLPHSLITIVIHYSIMCLLLSAHAHAANKWYTGGNLHRASITQWNHASVNNRLATAADWVIVIPHIKHKVQRSGSMDNLRSYATQLMTCINTAVKGNTSNGKVSEIAASCIVLKGWH